MRVEDVIIQATGLVDAPERVRGDVQLDHLPEGLAVQPFPVRVGLPESTRPAFPGEKEAESGDGTSGRHVRRRNPNNAMPTARAEGRVGATTTVHALVSTILGHIITELRGLAPEHALSRALLHEPPPTHGVSPPAGHRPGREARARESLPKRDSTRSLTRRCGSARAAKDAGVLIRARRDGPRRSFCRAPRRAAGLKSRVPNANQGGLGSRPGAPGGEPVRSCGISKGTLLVKIGRRSR